MTDHYDALETRKPGDGDADLFARLPECSARRWPHRPMLSA
jgi:hypothetical protein